MKRLVPFIIGMLLLAPVAAQAQEANTAAALAAVAVSPLVEKTAQRVGNGIRDAWNGDAVLTFFESMLPDNWRIAMTEFLAVDTQWTTTARSLQTITSCQRIDLFLLEELMEEIRTNIKTALTRHNLTALLRLTTLAQFLNERYANLANFGTDPLSDDAGWGKKQIFDAVDFTEDTTAQCNFTTDYLPPVFTAARYGCDEQALSAALDKLSTLPDQTRAAALQSTIMLERNALGSMEGAVTRAAVVADNLRNVQRILDNVQGRTPLPAQEPLAGDGTHQVIAGCYGELPAGVWLRAKTGPFSLDPDNNRILTAFRAQRRVEGSRRAIPAFLQRRDSGFETPDVIAMQMQGSNSLDIEGRQQGENEAEIFAAGIDPLLTMNQTLSQFSLAVGRLGSLATDMDGGVRGFVRDFTRWLAASCQNRPCKNRLDAVLKVIYADECFPFTSGQFLTDTADSSSAKKCLEAAGLRELVP